jgi:hypothetical protein
MQLLRKIVTSGTSYKKYVSVRIPIAFSDIFVTKFAVVEMLPDRSGIVLRPATMTDIQRESVV